MKKCLGEAKQDQNTISSRNEFYDQDQIKQYQTIIGQLIWITGLGDLILLSMSDRIPSTTPGAEPPRDAKDSGSARSHSTHLETRSSNRP